MTAIAENYLLGMDLGTTNVKAIIMAEDGTVVSSSSMANHLIFPAQSCAEQDANEWWANALTVLQNITKQAGSEIVSRIRGISVSSQTVSMLPVDREGTPLRHALIWMDSRSNKEIHFIKHEVGVERYMSIVGAQPDVAFLPNKILWFKNNEPELFAKTEKILQASSFINFKLTGLMTMDIDQAGKSQCFDITKLKWSDEIAQAIGVDLNKILPQPVPVTDVIGTVTREAAALTGLAEGTPVIAGASDAVASMYAIGLSQLGEAGESAGTSSLVFAGSRFPSATNLPIVAKVSPIREIPYVFDAPISNSGSTFKWYLDTLGEKEKEVATARGLSVFDYINQLALEVPAGSNGVLFLPYLMGERAPLWNAHARGTFIGLQIDTTKADILRSVFEGTAFALRHVMETIKNAGGEATSLRITGGGSKSRTWSQIKASMLRMPVLVMDERAGDVPFGDALMAGYGVGLYPNLTETTKKLVQVKEIIQPNEEWADTYDKIFPFYVEMYRHLDADLVKYKSMVESL